MKIPTVFLFLLVGVALAHYEGFTNLPCPKRCMKESVENRFGCLTSCMENSENSVIDNEERTAFAVAGCVNACRKFYPASVCAKRCRPSNESYKLPKDWEKKCRLNCRPIAFSERYTMADCMAECKAAYTPADCSSWEKTHGFKPAYCP